MTLSFHLRVTAVLVLIVWTSTGETAEPIVISSGTAQVTEWGTSEATPISLIGSGGFTLDAVVGTGVFQPVVDCGFVGCAPGQPVSFDARWSGVDLIGTATVDGQTHQIGGVNSANASVDFKASAVMPAAGPPTATVTARFQFTGRFFYPPTDTPPMPETLIGSGVMTTTLTRADVDGNVLWRPQQTVYSFQAPAAVREPGTLGLVVLDAGMAVLQRPLSRRP